MSPEAKAMTLGEIFDFDLMDYVAAQVKWSRATFGPGPRTKGLTAHIRKELLEIEATPDDLEEWIDVIILALDGAWRCGALPDEIIAQLIAKARKNHGRQWPAPMSQDEPVEHVREDAHLAAEAIKSTLDLASDMAEAYSAPAPRGTVTYHAPVPPYEQTR
jgi:hypothetical protein